VIADGLAALADPTRRRIFELVAAQPTAVGVLAEQLPVSRPAVSQHLKQLHRAGLVVERRIGTRHVFSIDPSGVAALRDYFDGFWRDALESFQQAIEAQPSSETKEGS
jgi:DNA-binding transcriptional ArsR family regulator